MRVAFIGSMLAALASLCSATGEVGIWYFNWDRHVPGHFLTHASVCAYGHDIYGVETWGCDWERSYWKQWDKMGFYGLDVSRPVYIQISGDDALWATQFWVYGDDNGVDTWRVYGEQNQFGFCMSTDVDDWRDDGWANYVPARNCFATLRFDPDNSVWGYWSHVHHMGRRLDSEMSADVLDALPETDWVLLGASSKTTVPPGESHPQPAFKYVETAPLEDGNSADRSMVPPAFEGGETAPLEDGNSAEESAVGGGL